MTRLEILEAAAHIFGQKGFHATSMHDIALAVNLQKASLYHHFSSKQELLLALLDQALDLLIDRIGQVAHSSLPPEAKLQQAMIAYLAALAEHKDLAAVLLLDYRSLAPELRARHVPRRDRFERMWRDLVLEGKEAGIFCCDDPSLVGRALLGVMNWTITWYREDGKLSADEIASRFALLFLRGLVTRTDGVGELLP